ncbi:MAG: response regulator [Desulfuromonadaceae bacterium]|nr:response regulator [Desulfuromonadaceae bacterium]
MSPLAVTKEAAMEEQGILVADKDTAFLREVADHFSNAGYQVETTDSAVRVINSILEKRTPVVMLGSDFDKKINLLELVLFLKKCNRHLAVILVSDEASLPIVKRIRKEGIFYYALRPVSEFNKAVEYVLKAA